MAQEISPNELAEILESEALQKSMEEHISNKDYETVCQMLMRC